MIGINEAEKYESIIAQTFLFRGIDRETILFAVSHEKAKMLVFSKGTRVFSRNRYQKALGIVLEGSVEVSKGEGTHRVILNTLERGCLFGAATLFNDFEDYVNDITAREQTVVLLMEETLIKTLMQRDFRIVENYLYYLSGRIRYLNGKIEGFTVGSAESKLARFLLEQSDAEDRVKSGYSMKALAGVLNMSRASLYRGMDFLQDEGMIVRENRMIYIKDRDKLNRLKEREG